MSVVSRHVAAPPGAVFAILADGDSYAEWVVGASATFETDPRWPEVGSTFTHRQGSAAFGLEDTTSVLACEPGSRLLLEARVRPILVAEVELTLVPERAGTLVSMGEKVTGGALAHVPQRLLDPAVRLRNGRSLARLAWLAETAADQERRRARGAGAPT